MTLAGISILFTGLVLLSVLAVSALAVLDYYRIRRGEVERQQGCQVDREYSDLQFPKRWSGGR